MARFGHWETLRDAPASDIQNIIGAVTFADVKAPRLKAALQAITGADGRSTLECLESLAVEDALAWLERLPGVGRKAAAATLNFSTLRKAALVIDTHHLRVLRRLQFIGGHSSPTQAHDRITPLLPREWSAADVDEHHRIMKILGQRICRHQAPICRRCPLSDLCPTALDRREPIEDRSSAIAADGSGR
ncbi:MAG: endonuclease III domain-containing protein [Inquilinaceae bacterium]